MKINKLFTLVLVWFLMSCSSNFTAITPTQTKPIFTFTPIPSTIPEPTSTATPTPSILEKHVHVLAYAVKDSIFFVDENGKHITYVKSDLGWVDEFKFSPDNNKVVFTLLDKKTATGVIIVMD